VQAQQVYFAKPYQAAMREIAIPAPGPGQLLLRSVISAISHGTEMNVYRGFAPQWTQDYDAAQRLFLKQKHGGWSYPLPYGYACVGVVDAIGDDVNPALLGTRAFCYLPHQSYQVLAPEALVPVGDLAPEKAVFFANANTALNGVLDAKLHYGDSVVVFGQGVIGQFVGQLCKASGCTVIVVDRLASRLAYARSWGADATINTTEVDDVALAVRGLTEQRGADTVFDVTGSPGALNEAIRTAAPETEVVALSWYAVPATDLYLAGEFHHNRVSIRSSQVGRVNPLLPTWSTARRSRTVLDFLAGHPVETMITSRFSPDQAADAYAAVDHGDNPPLQAVFSYR
jgi:2-desacetyl-2-hydroxyethyl bacteriochlorophyllide A dehydrogenase